MNPTYELSLRSSLKEVLDNIDYINGANGREIYDRAMKVLKDSKPLRFNDVNDFMFFTHDVLDMHHGLMIPGCIYCNGDM